MAIAIVFLATSASTYAQWNKLDRPWANPTTALVLDPYEGNELDFSSLSSETRVVGIIHRASIGSKRDAKYAERKSEALKRGYKWGSYHLGKPGDPHIQAEYYLSIAKPGTDDLMALDIETLDSKRSMSLPNARIFLEAVHYKTGRYPMIYGNQSVITEISRRFRNDSVFRNAPLWYARYKNTVTDFPEGTFDTYTLWQFKSELNCKQTDLAKCPYKVSGTKPDMDVSVFDGTVDQLKQQWPFGHARYRLFSSVYSRLPDTR